MEIYYNMFNSKADQIVFLNTNIFYDAYSVRKIVFFFKKKETVMN